MCASKIGSCAATGVAPRTTAASSIASTVVFMAAMVALAHGAGYSAATTRRKGDAMGSFSRRQALRVLGGAGALLAGRTSAWGQAADPILAGRPLVRYPQKTDLILLTARPPQLET